MDETGWNETPEDVTSELSGLVVEPLVAPVVFGKDVAVLEPGTLM